MVEILPERLDFYCIVKITCTQVPLGLVPIFLFFSYKKKKKKLEELDSLSKWKLLWW